VAEANNGGDMIEALLRNADANVPYKKVTASRGKVIRAEPVSALYEQHRVHHHGTFGALEGQMIQWNPQTDTDSPDRLDAMVWAVTELASGTDGWAGYVKAQVEEDRQKGIVAGPPAPRTLVDGSNRDACECGSTFWIDGKCLKCCRPRPQ
jgi:hypothetical protein